MNCGSCKKAFAANEADDVKEKTSFGDDLEIEISCPHCGQGYYAFIPLDDFTLDPSMGPTKESEGA